MFVLRIGITYSLKHLFGKTLITSQSNILLKEKLVYGIGLQMIIIRVSLISCDMTHSENMFDLSFNLIL